MIRQAKVFFSEGEISNVVIFYLHSDFILKDTLPITLLILIILTAALWAESQVKI